jgi:acyl dehydratase
LQSNITLSGTMRAMNEHPSSPPFPLPLPRMSAATLLRALFQQPSTAAAQTLQPVRHRLDRIDDASIARYRAALGFEGSHVPLTWYYLLVQRAHLGAMLGTPLPFRLAGIIHVDNALAGGIQPGAGRPLDLQTSIAIGAAAANGAVHATLDTRAAQDGGTVFSCRSTYLVVRGQRDGAPRTPAPAGQAMTPLAGWQLAASSGRAYAALSGDWNPIHLWPWSARLMGLKAPIIHGMHTLGRACAELERAGARPVTALDGRFRAPIPLGSAVALSAHLDGGRYAVEAGGRLAVDGGFRFA